MTGSLSLPKLREDLTVSRQVSAQGRVFILKDPVGGQFYRFGEAEHFVARQLDGHTPFEAVRQRAEAKFGAQLSEQDLRGFVERLDKKGLLATPGHEGVSSASARPAKRIQGSLLFLRCKLLDPDRLLERWVGKLGFCFTPGFVVLSAALMVLAAGILLTNWDQVGESLRSLYRVSAIPLVVVTLFVVVTAHEFAHGFTCKHFGGQVHEMGFLLMYFQPALYCNVSDAWLFAEKSKRLWVGLAGPYFELFLWSVATVLWRLTDPQTWIHGMAFIVMSGSGLRTLLNFNPILKWDGYYLLSDWVGIANLRRKAFRYIGAGIKRFWGGVVSVEEIPIRERRILLWYGLVAVVGSFAFMGLALASIGGYLIEQGHSLAFVLFAGLLGTRFRRRLRKMFGGSANGVGEEDWNETEEFGDTGSGSAKSGKAWRGAGAKEGEAAGESQGALNAEREPLPSSSVPVADAAGGAVGAGQSNGRGSDSACVFESAAPDQQQPGGASAGTDPQPGVSAPGKKERSSRRRLRRQVVRWMKVVAVVGGTAALLLFGRMELRVAGELNVLPVHNADVRAEVEGIVEEICVDEGERVRPGDVIARLSDRDGRAELKKIEAQIEESQARLKLLEAGARPQEIQVAQIVVARAEEQLKFKRDRLGRDLLLYQQQLLSLNDYEESARQVAVLEGDLAEAKRRLELLLAGSRPEEIEAMAAQLASLETQRGYWEEQLRRGQVLSPAAGIVTTPSRQLQEMKHQLVKKGDLIAKVHNVQTITALIRVSEKEIADVRTGQPVALKVRAYPERVFTGKVTEMATTVQGGAGTPTSGAKGDAAADANSAAHTLLVTTEIDNQTGLLKPGMSGMAKIDCGQRRCLDLVGRRLSRTFRVEFWSWW